MSYFRPEIDAMQGYVPGEQPQGGKCIKLNTNENPYPCSPAVARAVQSVLRTGLGRYPDPLANAFRVRAAQLYGVERDWILCGNGSDDILTMVTRAFVGPGQVLRMAHPSYILYRTLAQIQGARTEEIDFTPDWQLPAAFGQPRPGVRLAILPNPNSPSGTLLPPEEILALAESLDCPLLVDEAYAEFSRTHCLDLVRRSDRILVSRSLSKSYALAGLRFGYVVAQPHIIAGLAKVKDSYNCDSLSIAAATAAIDDQAWLRQTREKIVATRERLTRRMRELGFQAVDSEANFVWNMHPRPVRPWYEQLKAAGILVRYMDYRPWGDGLRISVGTDEQVDALLRHLEQLL